MLRRFFWGCAPRRALRDAASAETITYLLPAPLSLPAFGPFVVAKQRGYFKAEGLEVSSRSPRAASTSPSRSARATR